MPTPMVCPLPDLRARALARWQKSFDPGNRRDPVSLREAALLAPIVEFEGGPCFASNSFGELADFLAEMPF